MLAVLGVGALLLYLAYSGQQLTGFKAGGVEATLAKVVDEVVNDPKVPDQVKARVSEAVEEGRAPASARRDAREFLTRRDKAIAYEKDVLAALRRIGADANRRWEVNESRDKGGLDITVTRNGGIEKVLVECRWSSEAPSSRQLEDWIYDLRATGALGEGIVLVVAQPPGNSAARKGIVVWKDKGSDPLLAQEVESAFQ